MDLLARPAGMGVLHFPLIGKVTVPESSKFRGYLLSLEDEITRFQDFKKVEPQFNLLSSPLLMLIKHLRIFNLSSLIFRVLKHSTKGIMLGVSLNFTTP